MPYIKGADRGHVTLMPDCLDDYVSDENPVRVIDAFINSLDIEKLGIKAESAVEGRPGYDPRDMLKLYIYGCVNKVRSSRRLQREAGRNVEVMWLLRKIVPDFRCIADFRKDNAGGIKHVFREFVKLCDKAGLLSHETVVIDGSKFRAVNADQKAYVRQNVQVMMQQADERIEKYMAELEKNDASERRPETLSTKEIRHVLEYLRGRKQQLSDALSQLQENATNQLCVTDPECRLMKTRDGYKPSYNVQTAVEAENHIIVHYDVTNENIDWNLLEGGIKGAKEALGVKTLEGVADKGYACDEQIMKCLLNGDTPTTYPNKGQDCRTFIFQKTDEEITDEMLASKDHETMKQCISAGQLPNVLRRDDVTMEITKKRAAGSYRYLNQETGELVTRKEMEALGGTKREKIDVQRDEPLHPYFERDIEKDTVVCPMGQTLYYAGPGNPDGIPDKTIRRYHRLSVCLKCRNKCTMGKKRVVGFKEAETRVPATFYDRCKAGRITQRVNHAFVERKPSEDCGWDEWVTIRFYPNQHKLRKHNEIVEHPYGTVKWWNDGRSLLMKGKIKASVEMALAFLGYNFKRAVNLLGTKQLIAVINA